MNDAAITGAQTRCTAAAYNEALASYKSAVAKSKDRLRNGVCESEDGYIASIVADAHAAVTTCGAFHDVIRTSPWAQPIRDALKGNLSLPALTGDLDTKTWSGAAEALAGTTLYGPAPGAYGNMSKVEFAEGGVALVSELVFDDEDAMPHWVTHPNGSFSVGKPAANGALPVTLRYGNPSLEVTYELKADPRLPGAFVLEPTTAIAPPEGYSSVPSECEA